MSTSYVIYYTENGECKSQSAITLEVALSICADLRALKKTGDDISHITIAVENTNMVGELGVDSIIDGKTPDGLEYTWKKRR